MSTKTTAAAAILEFSATQPLWIQDALRRVCLTRELKSEDYVALLALLKGPASGASDSNAPKPAPLTADHLPQRPPSAPQTVIGSIADITNANRLATGQTLEFAVNGVTLIYGENGSGKSGYCRVLKKLCRVRDGANEDLLGDAFSPSPPSPAQATVRFRIGSADVQQLTWCDGTRAPADLSRISVFDSRAAPVYADKESRIEVLPYLLDVLPQLGTVLKGLDRRLEAEEHACDAKLRVLLDPAPAGSPADRLIARLQATTPDRNIPTEAEIRAAGAWNEVAEAELSTITQDLGSDPVARADAARATARSWLSLAGQLTPIAEALSVTSVNALRAEVALRDAGNAAAALAAGASFSTEPLPGVGGESWKQMFRYAREYSATAYPDTPFPVTAPDSRCVFCQQTLDAEAGERLRRFDAFVSNVASAEAARLAVAVLTLQRTIEALTPPSTTVLDQVLVLRTELSPDTSAKVHSYCGEADAVRRTILSALQLNAPIPDQLGLGPSPERELRASASLVTAEADRLDALSKDSKKRQELQARQVQLQGMKNLGARVETLVARRADLEARRLVKAHRGKCDTRAISNKNTELRRLFLTSEFGERLKAELRLLGLEYLTVKVEDRTDKGASLIGVGLATIRPIANNRAILSEGEFRGLALATFLAEVGGYDDQHGIIVDDPISSLDHRHRRQVAERLVAEASKGRQVIVFTHDLSFFHELHEAAVAATPPVPVLNHEVRLTQQRGCGFVYAGDEPWIAKSVQRRLGNLKNRLPQLRKCDDRASMEYRGMVQDFRADLRSTWERLVEEQLFNGVVTRFQLDVKTQLLRGVVVEDNDYRTIFIEMTKCSRSSGHDRALGLQQVEPSPNELAKDLEVLETYLDGFDARRKRTQSERRKLEDSPPASVL